MKKTFEFLVKFFAIWGAVAFICIFVEVWCAIVSFIFIGLAMMCKLLTLMFD